MLLDASHKNWFLVTLLLGAAALGSWCWLNAVTAGGLTGGSLAGLTFGLLGSVLMIYAGLLSVLRRVPSWWWIGSRKTWLKGHVWLGLLSGLLILCHSGFRWGGSLEQVLSVILVLTLATGVAGLVLQQFLPRLITTRIDREAPYDQIPRLCAALRRKADEVVAQVAADARVTEEARSRIAEFHFSQVRPFLRMKYDRASPLAKSYQAEAVFERLRSWPGLAPVAERLTDLQTFCEERRQLGEQERLHGWLHSWLFLHVPLCVALLVLGLAHAVMSLYY